MQSYLECGLFELQVGDQRITLRWTTLIPFQNTNLMHNSFILQQYVRYTTLLNMFRVARCSSSGGPIVSPQSLVSSPSVSSRTVSGGELHPHTVRLLTEGDDTRGCGDTTGPPDDEQRAARNMLRSVV